MTLGASHCWLEHHDNPGTSTTMLSVKNCMIVTSQFCWTTVTVKRNARKYMTVQAEIKA